MKIQSSVMLQRRPVSPAKTVALSAGTVSFAGQTRPEQQSSWGTYLRTAMMGLAMLATPLMVSTVKADGHSRAADIDEIATPVVNSPADIPQVNPSMTQLFVDLKHNPVLSHNARRELVEKLQQFHDRTGCEFKGVIYPSTQVGIEPLLDQLAESLQLGKKGEDNGGLLLLDAARVRANQPGKIAFDAGLGLGHILDDDTVGEILDIHAIPHIEAAEQASRLGNHQLAQQELDKAIVGTFDALIQKTEAGLTQDKTSKEQAAFLLQAALLLLLIGGSGITGAVLIKRYLDEKKRQKERLDLVINGLNSIQSGYKVTLDNVLKPDTLKALTEEALSSNPKQVSSAIDRILKDAQKEAKDDQKALAAVMAKKGVLHHNPDVRLTAVDYIIQDGLYRDEDFEALMILLANEQDARVTAKILDPLLQLSLETDVPQFKTFLTSHPRPAIRQLSVNVLSKFTNGDTLATFFDAMDKETEPEVIHHLEKAIVQVAHNAHTKGRPELAAKSLMLGKMEDENAPVRVRQAATLALGQLKKPELFERFYAVFAGTNLKNHPHWKTALVDGMLGTVQKQHQPKVLQALSDNSPALQLLSFDLLKKIGDPTILPQVFSYLEKPDTQYPQEATTVVTDLVTPAQRDLLVAKIQSNDPRSNDKDVMLAAIAGLRKVAGTSQAADDVSQLVTALGKDANPQVTQAITEALEESKENKASYDFLVKTLNTGNKPHVRNAVIQTLDNYGVAALEPLFSALERSTNKTPDIELSLLKKGILKIGHEEAALDTLVKKAESGNLRVREVASEAAVNTLKSWDSKYSYDHTAIKTRLKQLSGHKNEFIRTVAAQTYDSFIREKIQEIRANGESGSFSPSGDNYRKLEILQQKAEEQSVRTAAEAALERLRSRKRADDAAKARAAAEAAAAAARLAAAMARSRSSSSSGSRSYSSGSRSSSSGGSRGFSSGGGRSGGGRAVR